MDVNYCVGHLQYFDHHLYVLRGRTTKRDVGEKGVGGGRRRGGRWEEGGKGGGRKGAGSGRGEICKMEEN